MTDFYVGYHDPAPRRLRRFQRVVTAAVLVLAVGAALIAALGQRELPAAAFEFGTVRGFVGLVTADPYPSLIVPRGAVSSRYLLVGPGKEGADALVEAVVGEWAELKGTLVYRDGQAMIQVEPGSVAALDGVDYPFVPPDVDLGDAYLEGEIVGSKCYLGVMNPGSGIAHRACATVCIQGGVPPLLEVRHDDGRTEGIILAGPDGEAIGSRLAGLVATPVGLTGRLVRRGPALLLYVDPGDIQRLQ